MESVMDKKKILGKLLSRRRIDDNTCWLYTGGIEVEGYGQIYIDGHAYRVHRVSAYVHDIISDIEDQEQLVLHKRNCHNKKCWNPGHLYSGSYTDNSNDYTSTITHCPNGHDYSIYGSLHRRISWDRSGTTFQCRCRECRRMKYQQHKQQEKSVKNGI